MGDGTPPWLDSSLREKRPSTSGWRRQPLPLAVRRQAARASAWRRGQTVVISELSEMQLPRGEGTGPTWLVTVSRAGARPNDALCRAVLRAFDMVAAEEDNHYPGIQRGFFLVVDPAHRVECECKATELVIVEPDGFAWTNPKGNDELCRGCEYEMAFGQPCPVHARVAPAEGL